MSARSLLLVCVAEAAGALSLTAAAAASAATGTAKASTNIEAVTPGALRSSQALTVTCGTWSASSRARPEELLRIDQGDGIVAAGRRAEGPTAGVPQRGRGSQVASLGRDIFALIPTGQAASAVLYRAAI